jgi:hypothetical protein
VDNKLRRHLPLKSGRGLIPQRRVKTPGIVERFDVIKHTGFGFSTGFIAKTMNPFKFERTEAALHGRMIEAMADPSERQLNGSVLKQVQIRMAGILTASNGTSPEASEWWRRPTSGRRR